MSNTLDRGEVAREKMGEHRRPGFLLNGAHIVNCKADYFFS